MSELISRQAAIDAVCEYCEYFKNENVIQSIKEIPSVQPQRWIPVTERLPEHSGFYIVTAIVTDDGGKLVGLRWFSQEHGWKFGKNPLAWMPLPEPWKGKE